MSDRNTMSSGDQPSSAYEDARADLERALHLGVTSEMDDPTLHPIVSTLTDSQIEWVSAWLAGEGFARLC